jgi:hypothetical protein
VIVVFPLWQQYLLEKRAVIDNDGGKLLNEDNDIRSVSPYSLTSDQVDTINVVCVDYPDLYFCGVHRDENLFEPF